MEWGGQRCLVGWLVLLLPRRAGLKTSTFGYATSLEDFSAISERLVSKILAVAAQEEYVLIGHSLGGVLLRAAINTLPATGSKKLEAMQKELQEFISLYCS